MSTASSTPIDMFRPPVNRAMRVLDRSCFQKRVPLSAAKVYDKTQISKLRSELGHDVLRLERFQCVQPIRGTKGEEHKALLLDPRIKPNGRSGIYKAENMYDVLAYCVSRYVDMEPKTFRARQILPS